MVSARHTRGLFSERTSQDSSPNAVFAAWSACEQAGRARVDLTCVNPTQLGLGPSLTDAVHALVQASRPHSADERPTPRSGRPTLSCYEPDPFGSSDARDFLGRHLQVKPERLLLTSSTSEAYALLLKMLCDPGDEILVPAPSYPLFDFLATFEGVKAIPYRLFWDYGWQIDFGSIARAANAQPRAIVVVSPNNPTGNYLTAQDFEALLDLELPLIVDEVFESYAIAPPPFRARPRSANRGLVFSLGGLSKESLLPQWKLAWTHVAGSEACVPEALERLSLLGDTFLSPAAAVQCVLPELVIAGSAARRSAMARIGENLHVARTLANGTAVTLLEPEGGVYLVVRVPNTQTDEEWAVALIAQPLALHVHPGAFFGFARNAHLVVSLLVPTATFQQGFRALVDTVQQACALPVRDL
jgi:alanine-synthesizing transaminase